MLQPCQAGLASQPVTQFLPALLLTASVQVQYEGHLLCTTGPNPSAYGSSQRLSWDHQDFGRPWRRCCRARHQGWPTDCLVIPVPCKLPVFVPFISPHVKALLMCGCWVPVTSSNGNRCMATECLEQSSGQVASSEVLVICCAACGTLPVTFT